MGEAQEYLDSFCNQCEYAGCCNSQPDECEFGIFNDGCAPAPDKEQWICPECYEDDPDYYMDAQDTKFKCWDCGTWAIKFKTWIKKMDREQRAYEREQKRLECSTMKITT